MSLDGRLTSLTTPASQVITLTYDAADRPAGITFPNGVSTGATYDTAGRLGSLAHARGGIDLASFGYGYNALGSITQIAELARTRNFTYDALLRLTAGGTTATPESYSYDAEGNRTASHLSAAHFHDAANRLTEDDGFCYGYDANGNLTTKTVKVSGTCTGGLTAYTWDAQDRLVRIDFPDLTFATYAYDGLGRRIEKDSNGTVTRYVYDGEDIVLEYDGTNALLARYSHGQRTDQPLAIERGATLAYVQADHLGSIRQVTNAAGTVVNSYDYDAYGNFENFSEALPQPYAFTGREFDPESGLHYYRARYYDPATGRFISEDLFTFSAGDTNFYRYVYGDPINLVDPSGLTPVGERLASLKKTAALAVKGGIIGTAVKCLFDIALSGVQIALSQVTSTAAQVAANLPLPGLCKVGLARTVTKKFTKPKRNPRKLEPIDDAAGPHTSFRRGEDGRVTNYETYDQNPVTGNWGAQKRFRGDGKPHGDVETPIVLEPKPGKGPGAPTNRARKPRPEELPKGY